MSTEADLKKRFAAGLRARKFKVISMSDKSTKGIPDLLIAQPSNYDTRGGLALVECKRIEGSRFSMTKPHTFLRDGPQFVTMSDFARAVEFAQGADVFYIVFLEDEGKYYAARMSVLTAIHCLNTKESTQLLWMPFSQFVKEFSL